MYQCYSELSKVYRTNSLVIYYTIEIVLGLKNYKVKSHKGMKNKYIYL